MLGDAEVTRPAGRTRALGAVLASTAVLVAAVVWWWPLLTGDRGDVEVLVLGDSFLHEHPQEVTYRIHEDGFAFEWADPLASWCDAAAVVGNMIESGAPDQVVLSFAEAGTCVSPHVVADVASTVRSLGAEPVIVVQPGSSSAADAMIAGSTIVDPTRLLGMPPTAEMGCQWWDDCTPAGTVVVRDESGTLTAAGSSRVARMLVAALR
jgi:hypothetical protein